MANLHPSPPSSRGSTVPPSSIQSHRPPEATDPRGRPFQAPSPPRDSEASAHVRHLEPRASQRRRFRGRRCRGDAHAERVHVVARRDQQRLNVSRLRRRPTRRPTASRQASSVLRRSLDLQDRARRSSHIRAQDHRPSAHPLVLPERRDASTPLSYPVHPCEASKPQSRSSSSSERAIRQSPPPDQSPFATSTGEIGGGQISRSNHAGAQDPESLGVDVGKRIAHHFVARACGVFRKSSGQHRRTNRAGKIPAPTP